MRRPKPGDPLQEPLASMLRRARKTYEELEKEHELRRYDDLYLSARDRVQKAKAAEIRCQAAEALDHWMWASFYLGASV